MTKFTRTLLAMALASSTAQLAACGDDDGPADPTPGDTGTKTPLDGSVTSMDSSIPDSGVSSDGAIVAPPPAGPQPLTACPSDPHITANAEQKVCIISAPTGNPIKTNLTLSPVKDYKGYVLSGVVYVGEDVGGAETPVAGKAMATLTITEGTMLAGLDDRSGLAVNRGSKLEAIGSKTAPIVFTSIKDMLGGGAPSPTDWGGIVLMGRATQNKPGTPVTELDTGNYGGTIDTDSSGTLKYVRVLYTGSRSSMEKEFNGISFYACGSGTTADYVQVHAGSDDAIEFFGGLPTVKHLVVSGPGDDSVDWTDGFRGKLQFVVSRQVANFGDNGIEADNQQANEAAAPISAPTLANVTFLGQPTANGADGPFGIFLRRGTKAQLFSFLVTNFKNGCVNVNGDTSGAFVGTPGMSIASSRITCATNYVGKGEQYFTGGTGNSVLASADVLTGFLPKADSGLLTGGTSPSDAFFEQVSYIGAFGAEDWTAGWTAYPDFTPK